MVARSLFIFGGIVIALFCALWTAVVVAPPAAPLGVAVFGALTVLALFGTYRGAKGHRLARWLIGIGGALLLPSSQSISGNGIVIFIAGGLAAVIGAIMLLRAPKATAGEVSAPGLAHAKTAR
jgi:hypothetical protein